MNEKAVWRKVDKTREINESTYLPNQLQEGFINKGGIAFCFTATKEAGEDKYVVKVPRDREGGQFSWTRDQVDVIAVCYDYASQVCDGFEQLPQIKEHRYKFGSVEATPVYPSIVGQEAG